MGGHTPGSWVIDSGERLRVIAEGTPWSIAECTHRSDVGLGERVANARLIAAAPELLEVVERLVAVVAVGGNAADLAWDEIDALAGHAIRKVRGDS